jgi:hypothetical protein
MSQFLWVEDFGHVDADIEATTTSVFGRILANQTIPDNKYKLRKFLASQGILLKLDFLEALEFIRNPEQLLGVDYIILDVWLPVETTKNLSAETGDYLQTLLQRYHADKQTACARLEKVAGYQLYVELIMEIGFPKEHILFCSNHAEELSSINKAFSEAKLQLPEIPTKQREADIATVQTWVKTCRENHYSVLRRGILNVLTHIKADNLQLTPPFADEDDPVDMPTFLTGLEYLLKHTLKEPADTEKHSLFRTVCDSLTKPFERFSKELLYRGLYRGKNTEVEVKKEYLIPAYLVRNWIAHGVMNNPQMPLSTQDTAFIFMLVIKSLFDYSCFEVFKSLYSYQTVTDNELVAKLSAWHESYSYPKECDIFELIRLKGEKKLNPNWQQEPFMDHVYASFLFNCLKSGAFKETKGETELYKKTRTNLHGDQRGYYFNLSYRLETKDDLFETLKPIAYHQIQS